ncbi:MAG: hypothetical protein FWD69_19855 [Polyangiaceae bacterium]|nr:hypothetical protein [Polyangiaceae bacterium]
MAVQKAGPHPFRALDELPSQLVALQVEELLSIVANRLTMGIKEVEIRFIVVVRAVGVDEIAIQRAPHVVVDHELRTE